jgi:hypothetical protein
MASRKKVSPKKTGSASGRGKGVTAPTAGRVGGSLPPIQDQKTMKKKSKKVGRTRR